MGGTVQAGRRTSGHAGAVSPLRGDIRWVAVGCLLALAAGCDGPGEANDDPEASGADQVGSVEEIIASADGLDLQGTLRLPDGDPPFAAVVIVHGSGPHNRDGNAPGQLGLTLPRPVAVYRELASGLQERGYAAATWDKRTCGPFNDCADNGYPTPPDDLTFEVFADDAGAVLDTLAARDDLSDLIVIGHSKGGTVVAGLATERTDLAAVVLLATPAVPIHETLAAQAETFAGLVSAAGQAGTPAADAAVAEIRSLAENVAAIAGSEVDGPDVGGASRAFWASWIEASHSAPDAVASTGVPALVLGGAYDWNVPPAQVEAWEPFLAEHDRLEILPEITHALTHLGTDDPAAIGPQDVGTEVDAAVVDAIADWLDNTLPR